MAFDATQYKKAIALEWGCAACGWHNWIDRINEWLGPATEFMLDRAGVANESRVIDIAAGDGGQSVAAAGRVGPSGEVLATDIAPEFVALANAVASRLGLSQLRAETMDAEALTVPDDYFDSVICRLGLMYLPNLNRGLSETYRVLSRSGSISAIVFTTAEKTPFFSLPVSIIRKRRGLSPPEPGQPGPFSLGTRGLLVEQLRAAGYRDVQESVVSAPLRFDSADECLRWRREASGTMQEMLRGLNDAETEDIWAEILDALKRFETPEGFESPCELLVCSGRK